MKVILFFCLIFLANCASQTTAQLSNTSSSQISSANQSSNSVNSYLESQRINQENVEKLEIQNEKFKTVPEEFKDVDFKNYSYRSDSLKKQIKLKDGKYEYDEPKTFSGGWFDLSKVYYVDLTGDNKKEAVVFLWEVGCGASCDGGSAIIYFYSTKNIKPELIGKIGTGGKEGGCALKSLTIENKKIRVEQFGKCTKSTERPDKLGEFSCKFCVKGLTKSVYKIFNSRLTKESIETSDTADQNIMNYVAEVSINE